MYCCISTCAKDNRYFSETTEMMTVNIHPDSSHSSKGHEARHKVEEQEGQHKSLCTV